MQQTNWEFSRKWESLRGSVIRGNLLWYTAQTSWVIIMILWLARHLCVGQHTVYGSCLNQLVGPFSIVQWCESQVCWEISGAGCSPLKAIPCWKCWQDGDGWQLGWWHRCVSQSALGGLAEVAPESNLISLGKVEEWPHEDSAGSLVSRASRCVCV